MQIVLPGALPDPAEARELAEHVQQTAPTLAHWLQRGHARTVPCDPATAGCAPHEQWMLVRSGFRPQPGQNLSSGLGPLLAPHEAAGRQGPGGGGDAPVWLAELVHIAPSRDGAALLPARDLAIEPAQSVALFSAAQSLIEESGFAVAAASTTHWRVDPQGENALPASVSPALVSVTSVNDWWPQDTATRPWRRLVNALQMQWFDHPVNRHRQQTGLPPVNSLWVFGGASRNQFPSAAAGPQAEVRYDLADAHARHDWGRWLAALGELETHTFEPLARHPPALILTGRDRCVEIRPDMLRRFTRWLPGGRDTWRKWWSPRN